MKDETFDLFQKYLRAQAKFNNAVANKRSTPYIQDLLLVVETAAKELDEALGDEEITA